MTSDDTAFALKYTEDDTFEKLRRPSFAEVQRGLENVDGDAQSVYYYLERQNWQVADYMRELARKHNERQTH